MTETNELYDAGRLIQWALQPDARPTAEPEYRELLNRYMDRLTFRSVVQEIAAGFGLRPLDADLHGLVLVPTEGSVFRMKPSEYRASSGADDRLIDGLIQVAILATVFPRAQDLAEPATVARPPITVKEVELTLRQICDRIEEASRGQPDPSVEARTAGVYEAWRVYQRRASVKETRDERKSPKATLTMIEHGLEFLRLQGCFQRTRHSGQYQPTWRYQMMVQEFTANQIYKAVRDLLERQ